MITSIIPNSTAQISDSPFDSIRHQDADGEFWYARELSQLLGYPRWADAEDMIDRAKAACQNSGNSLIENFSGTSRKTNGRPKQDYRLSRFACYLVAQNGDPRKQEIAQAQVYFAVKTREAEVVIPAQSDRLRELEIELKLEQERNKRIDRQDSMLIMHGREVVLALSGCADAIVREQVKVTEVINLNNGNTDVFLSAEQTKVEVRRRTGQKVKSLKSFTDEIRKAGRDDLLIAVTRPATSEYIHPDKLDEAIAIVYGKSRQGLIGCAG